MARYKPTSPATEPYDFNARIRYVRTQLCSPPLTQTEMSKALKLSFRMYQEFEITKRAPRAETLARMVRYFEQSYPARRIDLRWLLLGDGRGSIDELAAVIQNGIVVDASAALQKLIGAKPKEVLGAKSERFLALDSRLFVDKNVDENSEAPYPVTILTVNDKRVLLNARPQNISYRKKPARLLRLSLPQANHTGKSAPQNVAAARA